MTTVRETSSVTSLSRSLKSEIHVHLLRKLRIQKRKRKNPKKKNHLRKRLNQLRKSNKRSYLRKK